MNETRIYAQDIPYRSEPLYSTPESDAGLHETVCRATIFPKTLHWWRLWPGFTVALLALAAIPFASRTYPGISHMLRHCGLGSFYSTAVQFASPTLIVMLAVGIWILQPQRRHTLFVFLIAMFITTAIRVPLKLATCRARPRYSILMREPEKNWIEHYLAEHPRAAMKPQRVDQWLGLNGVRPLFADGYASFPSGHASSSFVLAAYLGALFPEATVIWYVAAGGCAAARVAKGRHWPEDVLFGGALGWLVAQMVFSWRWPVTLGLRLAGRDTTLNRQHGKSLARNGEDTGER